MKNAQEALNELAKVAEVVFQDRSDELSTYGMGTDDMGFMLRKYGKEEMVRREQERASKLEGDLRTKAQNAASWYAAQ